MNDYYERFYNSMREAGLTITIHEEDYQLMAYLLVLGGGHEATTQNEKLRHAILNTQGKLNLYGGETPTIETAKKIKKYVSEINQIDEKRKTVNKEKRKNPNFVYNQEHLQYPQWLETLSVKFKLKLETGD